MPPVTLFDHPLVHLVGENSKLVADNIKAEARTAHWVVIATDNDREGENIGFEIIELCQSVRPSIVTKRMRFSAVTPAYVHAAHRSALMRRAARFCVPFPG